jgi:hypothetical protein
MANIAALNNIQHKDLRVMTQQGKRYGDDAILVNAFPMEFFRLQAHYPIVFRKTEQGLSFEAFALLGFAAGENLFLKDDSWDADYIPLAIQRQPFLIGRSGDQLAVHIDLDNQRVRQAGNEGEALFLPHGSPTPYMDKVNSILLAIHQGMEGAPAFAKALMDHDLLESFVYDIQFDYGERYRLDGFYTIKEEKLRALDAAALDALHRAGNLQAIYMALASMGNFGNLIARKNRLHAAAR